VEVPEMAAADLEDLVNTGVRVTVEQERPSGMPPTGSILGTRVLRVEDPLLLTRGAVYTDDAWREPRPELLQL
jgi:hypothetical protein